MISLAGLGTGCGSAFSEILFQAASSVGRSALDIALADLANDLADAAEQQGSEDVDDDAVDDHTNDPPPDDTPGDSDGGDLSGDAAAGAAVYTDNGCGSCHCDDASGGCALSAPGLTGVSTTELEARLTGELSHPIQADLTATELADLEAYLTSLGG